jgi:mRNA interferase MazF
MTTASYNETNPFAIRFIGPKGAVSYILGHQPKSFDWRARAAKPHTWKQAPEEAFVLACETLNQIIAIS